LFLPSLLLPTSIDYGRIARHQYEHDRRRGSLSVLASRNAAPAESFVGHAAGALVHLSKVSPARTTSAPSHQKLSSGTSRPVAMISMSVLPVKASVECSMTGDVVSGCQTSIFVNDNFDIIHAIRFLCLLWKVHDHIQMIAVRMNLARARSAAAPSARWHVEYHIMRW
jgi:hypothetical protein